MTRRDDAWMAGLFEGEGTIFVKNRATLVAVTSTDYDVLEALLAVAGYGTISKEMRHKGIGKEHYKPFKRWEVRGIPECQGFLRRIRPYLLSRRGARADELLALVPVLNPARPGRRGGKDPTRLCMRGLHPMNGKRYCYACDRIKGKARRDAGYIAPSRRK